MKPDYHDYVIKDGKFIGKFEEMYRNCTDPWHASYEDYEDSACSLAARHFYFTTAPALPLTSLGCGTGRHLAWFSLWDLDVQGVDISPTAIARARQACEWESWEFLTSSIIDFFRYNATHAGTYLFREVLWYILPDWTEIVDILKAKHQGAIVIVELSFYDDQQYGRDYFDGPDDFIAKWPFTIEKIVRQHTTKHQREGRIMVAGRI